MRRAAGLLRPLSGFLAARRGKNPISRPRRSYSHAVAVRHRAKSRNKRGRACVHVCARRHARDARTRKSGRYIRSPPAALCPHAIRFDNISIIYTIDYLASDSETYFSSLLRDDTDRCRGISVFQCHEIQSANTDVENSVLVESVFYLLHIEISFLPLFIDR